MNVKSFVFHTVALMLALAAVLVSPAAAASKDDYKKMPGYVDFSQLALQDIEASVEVFLKGPLLKMAREAVKNEEPELAGALDGVQLICVNVFPLDDLDVKSLEANTKKLASGLEKKGWEMAVRVRERDEDVYIYLLPGNEDTIEGLVVMVIGDDDQAVFVNIVGTINPEQIGRIGQSIHVNGLDMHDWGDYYDRAKEDTKEKSRTNRR